MIVYLIAFFCIIFAVDIAWLAIDKQSFMQWGWIVVSLVGFSGGLLIGYKS
jgi:hypothetical protein